MTASVLALYPTMTLETPQQKSAVVSIKANGQAFANVKGKPSGNFSAAALTLYGSVRSDCIGGLEMGDFAGSLQIGLANYTVTNGEGGFNKKNNIDINAKASTAGKKLELILHGTTQNNTVVFDSKRSTLFPLYFLSLKGTANVTLPNMSTCTIKRENDHFPHNNATVTVTQNNTVTETVTKVQNSTVTATVTDTTTVTEQPTTATETVTQTVTQTASPVTVTTTETVTSTIANSTITVTETGTSATP